MGAGSVESWLLFKKCLGSVRRDYKRLVGVLCLGKTGQLLTEPAHG